MHAKSLATPILCAVLTCLWADAAPRPEAASVTPVRKTLRVAVFAGHTRGKVSGNSRGVRSHRGVIENEYNDRVVALFSQFDRSRGIDYQLFAAAEDIDLRVRPGIAARSRADVYLEIHHDAGQESDIAAGRWSEMEGFSLFYSGRSPAWREARFLAELIGDRLLARGFRPNHYHAKDIDGERRKEVDRSRAIYDRDLFVNEHASMASVLVECGCVVCPEEELRLSKPATQQRMVEAIHAALVAYRSRLMGPAGGPRD